MHHTWLLGFDQLHFPDVCQWFELGCDNLYLLSSSVIIMYLMQIGSDTLLGTWMGIDQVTIQ